MLTFFNIVWLALQLPVITGPVATAAMYMVARRLIDGELTGARQGWAALRRVALPAVLWGAANAFVVLAVVGNFWVYRDNAGVGWTVIRLVWAGAGLGWYVVNFYYWPFWLAQEDRSMRTTLRNSLLFVARRPGLGLGVALTSLLLIVVSILITLPFAAALMAWIALIGLTAVDAEFESGSASVSSSR